MKIYKQFADGTKDGGFEKYCADILTKLGYKCDLTPTSCDYGIDIIAQDILGNKIGIQCKNWNNSVGIDDVAKTLGGVKVYNLNATMVFATSAYTNEAKKFAKASNITLLDSYGIEKLALLMPNETQNKINELKQTMEDFKFKQSELIKKQDEIDSQLNDLDYRQSEFERHKLIWEEIDKPKYIRKYKEKEFEVEQMRKQYENAIQQANKEKECYRIANNGLNDNHIQRTQELTDNYNKKLNTLKKATPYRLSFGRLVLITIGLILLFFLFVGMIESGMHMYSSYWVTLSILFSVLSIKAIRYRFKYYELFRTK